MLQGHRDVKTEKHYPHPDLDLLRRAWITARQGELLKREHTEKVTAPFATHPKNLNFGKSLTTPATVLEKKVIRESAVSQANTVLLQ